MPWKTNPYRAQCHPKSKIATPTTLEALHYAPGSTSPALINVITVVQRSSDRQPANLFPALECVLGTSQPIHECLVEVRAMDAVLRFLVAVQERPGVPNNSLSDIDPGPACCMAVIVLRVGHDGVMRDFGGRSSMCAAERAVQRVVGEIGRRLKNCSDIGVPFLFPLRLRVE
ncbi:hypothetical protein C8Q77DRAFT_1068611 [Trametes polyzona]|nr:hypothetical protein C8Q77DRAFT_1068611 [Trametes polyzona]